MIGWIVGIAFLAFYVLSAIWARHETKTYYKDYDSEPTFEDAIFTLIPIVNFMVAVASASDNGLWKKATKIYFGK